MEQLGAKEAPCGELVLSGSPYEIGFQHGERLRGEIHGLLEDHLVRVNLLRAQPLDKNAAVAYAKRCGDFICRELPDLWREITGLADGARIGVEEALILQLRRELSMLEAPAHASCASDCTTIAVKTDAGAVIAQTIDLPGRVGGLGRIFRILPDAGGADILMYSFVGLLGYIGINSAGLAVGINMVTAERVEPGVPPYLIVRALLGCPNRAAAVAMLAKLKRASARCFALGDLQGVEIAECTTDAHAEMNGRILFHTNHFLRLTGSERSDAFSLVVSRKRLARLTALVESAQADGVSWLQDEEKVFHLLSDHQGYPYGICAHSMPNNVRQPETVAAVVLNTASRTLALRSGNPCSTSTTLFSLAGRQDV